MKVSAQFTDEAALVEIGNRIAAVRLERNLTQAALAEQAGVGKRTVERLESGASATQLSGFLRICRALGLLDQLDALVAEAGAGPIAQHERQGRRRRRASVRNGARRTA